MKILEDYKKIAQELLLEVDDEKIIKYQDKDGESAEMKAGSAKTMPADHPAKQAYDKLKGDDDGKKASGDKLGKGDFDRDGGDKPERDTSDDYDDDTGEYKGSDEKVKKLHKIMNDVKGDDDKYDYSYSRQQKLEKMTEKQAEGIQNGLKAEAERLEAKGEKIERKGYGPINLDDVPEGKYHSGDPYDEFVWDSEKDRENFLSAALNSSNWYTMTHPSEPGSFGERIDVKWKQEEHSERGE